MRVHCSEGVAIRRCPVSPPLPRLSQPSGKGEHSACDLHHPLPPLSAIRPNSHLQRLTSRSRGVSYWSVLEHLPHGCVDSKGRFLSRFGGKPDRCAGRGGNSMTSFAQITRLGVIGIPILFSTIIPAHADCNANGDTDNVNNFVEDSSNGSVSLTIDVNGDAFGSTHDGTIVCSSPLSIVSQQHLDGSCHFDGNVNRGIYAWHTQCPNFQGVHYKIELQY